jgi:hypothetical protein
MVHFASTLLRGVIATFTGLLIAGGTLTLAADRAGVQPTLVAVEPAAPTTLTVPDVTGQAYDFAKGILQDHGFAWHVSGPVLGFAANTVVSQQPSGGTVVLDTGAPAVTLALTKNTTYVERGTPENDAPYSGTALKLPAVAPERPKTTAVPHLDPVPVPVAPTLQPTPAAQATDTPAAATPVSAAPTTAAPTTAAPTTVTAPAAKAKAVRPSATTATAPPKRVASGRQPDFVVAGAPKEPTGSASLPDRVAALAKWIETHHDPSPANLNHWLYEHAYVVAGARFGWWHSAQALEALILVDRRAQALWGVGSQSRVAVEHALAEVRARIS